MILGIQLLPAADPIELASLKCRVEEAFPAQPLMERILGKLRVEDGNLVRTIAYLLDSESAF